MATEPDKYGAAIVWNNVQQSVTGTVKGSVQYVAAEVLVSSLLQRFTKIHGRSWQNSSVVHTLSLPLQGAFQGFFADEKDGYKGWDAEKNMELVWQGLHGVPAYLVAGYIADMSSLGFHMPKLDRGLAIGILGKVITRPLVGNLMPYLPTTVQEAYYVLDALQQDMRSKSSWKKKDAPDDERRRLLY